MVVYTVFSEVLSHYFELFFENTQLRFGWEYAR